MTATHISHDVDLIWSPDDDGWYFQRFYPPGEPRSETSVLYESRDEAMAAWQDKSVEWEDA